MKILVYTNVIIIKLSGQFWIPVESRFSRRLEVLSSSASCIVCEFIIVVTYSYRENGSPNQFHQTTVMPPRNGGLYCKFSIISILSSLFLSCFSPSKICLIKKQSFLFLPKVFHLDTCFPRMNMCFRNAEHWII